MNQGTTVVVLVIDAIGIPTIEHLLKNTKEQVNFSNLSDYGLGNLLNQDFNSIVPPCQNAHFSVSLEQASMSADSVIGHREMVGVIDLRSYNLFYNGFPEEYIDALESKIRRKLMFNKMSGGVEAIEKNYIEHRETGKPIIYASVCDPLVQIAMDKEVISLEEQYNIVDKAFETAMELGININRVIARPYETRGDKIIRTNDRHDVVLPLEQKTLLDLLKEGKIFTCGVAKTGDLIPKSFDTLIKVPQTKELDQEVDLYAHPDRKDTNPYSMQGTIDAIVSCRGKNSLVFSNFVDTDSLYGHTRDIDGAVKSLNLIDKFLASLEKRLTNGDVIIITGDHGMEHKPNYGYHSKEPIPFLAKRIGFRCIGYEFDFNGISLNKPYVGKGKTFAHVGNLVAQEFRIRDRFVNELGLNQYLQ